VVFTQKIFEKRGTYFPGPTNVYLEMDLFFDIWLDADRDIELSELYLEDD